MNTTEAMIWFIATAVMVLLVVGGGILMAANMLHLPHWHLPHRRHPH